MTTISAQVLADSLGTMGNRLTTLQLRYPRFIHAEFMTHRAFSRNASSSRAIPVERLIQDCINDTAMPKYWGKNQKGMQAGEEIDEPVAPYYAQDDSDIGTKEQAWNSARDVAIISAQNFTAAGYHKQIVNRLLEPFTHINVVVSATEWDNFFELRDHPDAEPHIQELARAIKDAMRASKPKQLRDGEWHLPYITDKDWAQYPQDVMGPSGREDGFTYDEALSALIKVSTARSARVSYLTHEGHESWHSQDIELHDRLVGSKPLHASPAEHQAQADTFTTLAGFLNPELHGNFVGFNQYRKMLERGQVNGF